MSEKQRRDALNPHSHGVGSLRLPSGEVVRVALSAGKPRLLLAACRTTRAPHAGRNLRRARDV